MEPQIYEIKTGMLRLDRLPVRIRPGVTKAAETPTGFGGFDIVAGQRVVTEDSSTDTVLLTIEGSCQFT